MINSMLNSVFLRVLIRARTRGLHWAGRTSVVQHAIPGATSYAACGATMRIIAEARQQMAPEDTRRARTGALASHPGGGPPAAPAGVPALAAAHDAVRARRQRNPNYGSWPPHSARTTSLRKPRSSPRRASPGQPCVGIVPTPLRPLCLAWLARIGLDVRSACAA